jgi:hypothetical protein
LREGAKKQRIQLKPRQPKTEPNDKRRRKEQKLSHQRKAMGRMARKKLH